jgi:predicted O-methyltransferase YrrM
MRFLFRMLQPLGLHLTRNHFYEPVPDTRQLKEHEWEEPSAMVGVDMNVSRQLNVLNNIIPEYVDECDFSEEQPSVPHAFHLGNEFFEALDAEVLHCMIRHFKPERIVEIGSGYSTLVCARAAAMNDKLDSSPAELVCIEPYPNETLQEGIPGLTRLTQKPVEEVSLDVFSRLSSGDIVFIDSSHVVKLGSDVIYEYLEILPRLSPGVLVHIHDIFLPDEYPRKWVLDEHKFWTEQHLLQAFLVCNDCFEVMWASSFMSKNYKGELETAIPSWRQSYTRLSEDLKDVTLTRDGQNVWPVSFWIRRAGV